MKLKALIVRLCVVLCLVLTPMASANQEIEREASTFEATSVVSKAISGEKAATSDADALNTDVADTAPQKALSTESLLSSLKDAKSTPRPSVSEGALGKMLLGLVSILLLIFASSWMLKRFNINKFGMASSLSVTGVLPIGTKEKVVVVDVEGTRLVLGVTAANITKLHVLEADKATSATEPVDDAGVKKNATIGSDFSEKMKKIMKETLKSD